MNMKISYFTQCNQCGPSAAHIGKTVNTVYERFFASGTCHLAPNNKNSALPDHQVSTGIRTVTSYSTTQEVMMNE